MCNQETFLVEPELTVIYEETDTGYPGDPAYASFSSPYGGGGYVMLPTFNIISSSTRQGLFNPSKTERPFVLHLDDHVQATCNNDIAFLSYNTTLSSIFLCNPLFTTSGLSSFSRRRTTA